MVYFLTRRIPVNASEWVYVLHHELISLRITAEMWVVLPPLKFDNNKIHDL